MFRILFLLLTLVSLSACVTPMRLGISEAEWQNYSPEERQKIKSGYYEILKGKRAQVEGAAPDGSLLHVRVSGGQITVPPFADLSSYSPVEFDIPNGDCQKITVQSVDGDKKVTLKACYQNKTLYLDPSRYDPDKSFGSIQLHYSPIWDRGFTFQNITSTGYAHLTHVNVSVRKYQNNDVSDSAN